MCYSLLLVLLVMSSSEQFTSTIPNSVDLSADSFVTNIRIPDLVLCQPLNTVDCAKLMDRMLECQQIVFNDPGFSYQQYLENIRVHRQMLVEYQSTCEGMVSSNRTAE